MDIFYEESSIASESVREAKKYKILQIVSVIFLTLGITAIILGFYFVSLEGWILWSFVCAWFFLAYFLLRKWKMRFNVSYDYAFVSGELRISRVININKRKLVARIDCEEMIQIGDVDNPSYERLSSDPATKSVICTSNNVASEGKFFMYILANHDGKKIFVLECRETLLLNLLKFVKRTVLESDYVMQEKKRAR